MAGAKMQDATGQGRKQSRGQEATDGKSGLFLWVVFVLLTLSTFMPLSASQSGESGDTVAAEVAELLDALANSGCRFYRNGNWYDGPEASSHLQRKFRYVQGKGKLASVEQFIEVAASRSSMSGEDYQVACPGEEAAASKGWLRGLLERLRTAKAASRPSGGE